MCRQCGTPVLLHGVTGRFVAEAKTDSTSAIRVVRRELERVAPGAVASGKVRRPFLVYVPFWLFSCRVDGYVFGIKPVFTRRNVNVESSGEQDDGSAPYVVSRTVKRRKGVRAEEQLISHSINMIVSAAYLEPLGIPSLGADSQMGLSGTALGRSESDLQLKVFDLSNFPDSAHIIDPAVSLRDAELELDAYTRRVCSGAGSLLEQRSVYLAVTGLKRRLVYYPLWVTEFVSAAGVFRAVVDGYTGNIVKGAFPPDFRSWEKACRILGGMWAGFFPLILSIVFSSSPPFRAFLFPALLLVAVAAAASVKFLKIAGKNAKTGSYI